MPVPAEDLPVTHHHDIYPGIFPSKYTGTLKGKVVFITGASRGIGQATALAFAQAGASIFLVSRKQSTLDVVRTAILTAVPDAKVEVFVANVVDDEAVKRAVEGCGEKFGRLDVVISNAGAMEDFTQTMAQRPPSVWWATWEVNIKGTFNVLHYTLPELAKRKGYLILLSSIGAQHRHPGASAYPTTKHAINRLAEFCVVEEPNVKTFALHPGAVPTELASAGGDYLAPLLIDTPLLPAWTMVRLVQGEDDWLSGRYVSVNWDLDEVRDVWKQKVLEEDALKNRLTMPTAAQGL